jgi:hypothetical protein
MAVIGGQETQSGSEAVHTYIGILTDELAAANDQIGELKEQMEERKTAWMDEIK